MDFTKLSNVANQSTVSGSKANRILDSQQRMTDSRRQRIMDAVRRKRAQAQINARKQSIMDAIRAKKARTTKVEDAVRASLAKRGKTFKGKPHINDSRISYRSLKKRIKDELEETTSTEEVIDIVTNYLNEAPAEDVITAALEVIGESVDSLQDVLENNQKPLEKGEGGDDE